MLESLFNKIAGLEDCNFAKETPTQVFSIEYCKNFKNNLFVKHFRTIASVSVISPQSVIFGFLDYDLEHNTYVKLGKTKFFISTYLKKIKQKL